MIGYYVHHQGRGHLHRAGAVAEAVAARGETVTGLSSLPRPSWWRWAWVQLPRDDADAGAGRPDAPVDAVDATARGQLHWVPEGHLGLRARSAILSAWLESAIPRLVVVDVSVEVALLTRLHGVRVVSVVLPGRRVDQAHLTGYRISSDLVATWPETASGMTPGLPQDIAGRVRRVGAVSRFPVLPAATRRPGPPRVAVLQGQGGGELTSLSGAALRALAPLWEWRLLGGRDSWVEDPSTVLRDADVVVVNAGEASLAEVAACRRPAVVIPAERPHHEQVTTAAVLEQGPWPAVVLSSFPETGWAQLLERAAALRGNGWADWCDGSADGRFAQILAAESSRLRSA